MEVQVSEVGGGEKRNCNQKDEVMRRIRYEYKISYHGERT